MPAAVLLAAGAIASVLPAQCVPHWLAGEGMEGTDGPVHAAVMWDPDGAGPAGPVLVIGGEFGFVGTTPAHNAAIYDPATGRWSAFAQDVPFPVYHLAAGAFGMLAASGAGWVARWSGTGWNNDFTTSANFDVSILVLPGGTLVAGAAACGGRR